MKHIATIVDHGVTLLLLMVAGLVPVLFFNQTTEFFDIPKLIFLIVSVLVLVGLWVLSWIFKGRVSLAKTPLNIPLLLLLGIVLVSTFLSMSRFPAIFGNFPRVHGSAVSWVVYTLLYFVTVSHLQSLGRVKMFLSVLYGSAAIVAFVTLLSFFGVFLPVDFARSVNFTPTGSTFSTIAFLIMLLPLPLISIIQTNKNIPLPVAMTLALLFSVTTVLVGSIPTHAVLVAVFVLCLLVAKPRHLKDLSMFLVPVATSVFVFILANLPFPGNIIRNIETNFPREIQLPLNISWKVTASAFRDAPFVGTGPSTYLFDFTSYKPLEFNALSFWNFSFDTAYNEFLHVLATLGISGLVVLSLICVLVLNAARANMFSDESGITAALSVSGVIAVVLLFVHATTMVSMVVTIFVFAALMMMRKTDKEKMFELSLGLKAATSDNKQFDLLPVILFVLFMVGAVPALYQTYMITAADYYHRQALRQASLNGTKTYEYLQKAEKMSPYIDLYRVDMAQTNFALANALAAQKGPSQASPAGSLTNDDKTMIQTLLSQAITEGRVSVTLSPRSSRNWEVLASIYRNINGVANNATTFSLDAYGRAIQLDPLNPALRLSVGGIYSAAKNQDMAIRFFTDAANLKPDYADAYYNLAIALRDKGDLQNAKVVAEQTVAILAKNTGTTTADYKIASTFLSDLNTKIANTAPAPASQTNSALGNQKLPAINVPDLNNPPKPSTPSAVVRNPNSVLPPAPSAAPTATP